MRLDLEVFGETQFSREILRVGDNAADMRPAFDDIHTYLLQKEKEQFSYQGRYSGGWKPLAASTVRYKAARNLDPRILHATLRLRDSLTEKGHPDHVFRSSADEMFFGSKVPYGIYHQKKKKAGARMPQRRPVELSDVLRKNILKMLQSHLVGSGAFG
jgi:phage gpG-like protein